jgi:aldose 1-epimerase
MVKRETRPPSGAQVEIRHGAQAATIVEVGGALRTYTAGGRAVLDGYGVDEMCGGARGQTLIPWPNRLSEGKYGFRGKSYQLGWTEPSKKNAIHGLVRWTNWQVAAHEPARVVMTHTLHAQKGWPFVLALSIEYTLDARGLTVATTATNAGAEPCPYAAGAHPYLTLGAPTIDDALLRIPGAIYLPTDERQIPTGQRRVDGGEFDFREPRKIGKTKIDYAFGELIRDPDGRARVVLASADGRARVALWLDEHYRWVEVFTGDTLEDERKRRTGLGVEPMTAPPNALATGTDVRVLEPGESLTTRWGIEPPST